MRIYNKFAKVFVFGMCFSLLSTGVALAETIDSKSVEVTSQEISNPEISSETLELQKEIDKYLFEDHVQELKDRGIEITYTVPVDNYVEIGILPFTDENVKFLKDTFGSDKVEIIDSQMSVLMATSGLGSDTPVSSEENGEVQILEEVVLEGAGEDGVLYTTDEVPEMATTSIGDGEEKVVGEDIVLEDEDQVKIVSVTDDVAAESTSGDNVESKADKSSVPTILGIGGLVVLLGGALAFAKKKKSL
jgi:hypothetical protein